MDENQLSQLVKTLYSSTDNESIQAASKRLNEWQQLPSTWQQADVLLGSPGMQGEFYYFFAQTLKSKIQYDMYQLPDSAYIALRDSLVQKLLALSNNSEARATRKQLCLCIADLVVQSAEIWPNSIPDLVNLLGTQHLALLLEILRLIPEEVENLKLMVESGNRNKARCKCLEHYYAVLSLLNTAYTAGVGSVVLECFLAWLKFDSPPVQYSMQDSPILQSCLTEVSSVSKDNLSVEDVVVETLTEVLRACSDYRSSRQHNPLVELRIFPAIHSLVLVLSDTDLQREVSGSVEAIKSLARLLAHTGGGMMGKVASDYNSQPEMNLFLQVLVKLFGVSNVEVSETIMPFLHDFLEATAPACGPIHERIFETLILRCAVTSEPSLNEADPFGSIDSEYFYFRNNECLKLLYVMSRDVLGRAVGLEKIVRGLIFQMNENSNWALQEGFAFCARDQLAISLPDPPSSLRDAVDFLIDHTAEWIDVQSIHSCSLVDGFRRRSFVAVVGALSGWAVAQSQILKLVDISAQVLLRPVVVHRAIHAAAANALRDICMNAHCRRIILESQPDILESVGRLFLQTVGHLSAKDHSVVTEGIVGLVSGIHEDALFVNIVGGMILSPIVDSMGKYRGQADVAHAGDAVDRVTAVLRSLNRLPRGSPRYIAIGEFITNRLWPELSQAMSVFRTEEEFVEKSCRLLKHAIRTVTDDFGKALIVPIGQTLVRDFALTPHSSYLYMAEVLGQEYAGEADVRLPMGEIFDSLLAAGAKVLDAKLHAAPFGVVDSVDELSEDLFGMAERFLRFCPSIVVKSRFLQNILALVVPSIGKIKRRETVDALSAFVEQLYGGYWASFAREDTVPVGPDDVARVKAILLELAPVLVSQLFSLIVQVASRAICDAIPSLLMVVNQFDPQAFRSNWVVRGLSLVPSSIMTDRDKQAALDALCSQTDERAVKNAVQDLLYRAKVVERRIKNDKAQ